MRKKQFILFMTLTALSLSACNSDSKTPETTMAVSEESTEIQYQEETVRTAKTLKTTAKVSRPATEEPLRNVREPQMSETGDKYIWLESYLKTLGLVEGSPTLVNDSGFGDFCLSGTIYHDDNLRIYQFDTDSDEYKALLDTGSIMHPNSNVGNLVLSLAVDDKVIFCEEHANKELLIKSLDFLFQNFEVNW